MFMKREIYPILETRSLVAHTTFECHVAKSFTIFTKPIQFYSIRLADLQSSTQ